MCRVRCRTRGNHRESRGKGTLNALQIRQDGALKSVRVTQRKVSKEGRRNRKQRKWTETRCEVAAGSPGDQQLPYVEMVRIKRSKDRNRVD